jgi:nitroreductase
VAATALTPHMRKMRVVRRFSDKPVPDVVLDDMLEVAQWTGTSKNTQPWHLVVVHERETLRALAKLGQFAGHLAGANVAIALVMDSKNNAFDCGRLAERLMLAAWAHGVGSCIGSIWPDDNETAAKALLNVPKERWVHQVISFGYPADKDATRVSRSPGSARILPSIGRRPVSELVSYERYGARR